MKFIGAANKANRGKEIIKVRRVNNEVANIKTLKKIKATKTILFFLKINKIDPPLARFTRKRGNIQITTVRSEKAGITTHPT